MQIGDFNPVQGFQLDVLPLGKDVLLNAPLIVTTRFLLARVTLYIGLTEITNGVALSLCLTLGKWTLANGSYQEQ